jgi:RHS repeat-associated protein
MLFLWTVSARADTLTVSVSGQFGADVLADQTAAPSQTWGISFAVDSNPSAANTDPFSFDAPFTGFSYLLDGVPVAVTPDSIRFFDSADGGLFTVFFGPETGFMNGMPIPEFSFSGDQVFSGMAASPTILPGSYPVSDVTYSDALNYDDEGASGTVAISGGWATVPEPSSIWLFLMPACLALFAGRRRPGTRPEALKHLLRRAVDKVRPCMAAHRQCISAVAYRKACSRAIFAFALTSLPGHLCAQQSFSKTIYVVPNDQTFGVGVWELYNCSASAGIGSYTTVTAPMRGTIAFAEASLPAPGCPAGSPSLPAAITYYTWTDNTPGVTTDSFQLNFIFNGATQEVINVSVVNTQAQPGKTLGSPTNLPGKATNFCTCGFTGGPDSAGGATQSPNSSAVGSGQSPAGDYARARPASIPEANNSIRAIGASDIGSGNLFYAITDYTTAGQNNLQFTRYYNSRGNMAAMFLTGYATVEPLATGLNANWRSNFDRNLEMFSSTSVVAERPDGQRLAFTLSGGVWTPETDIDMTLTQSGTVWTLTDQNDTVETYGPPNIIAGLSITVPYFQLNSIKTRNGYAQNLFYAGGQLVSVTDSYSRSLTFAYAGGALSGGPLQSVTTPDGLTITYGSAPATSLLLSKPTTVTFSTSPQTTLTYLYENASVPAALTGIIDENGNRYAPWTYESAGRVLTSQLGAGANLTTIAYNASGSQTVTNPLGVTDTYTFTTLQGVPKVTGISRAATATTAAATEAFTYDANGYLASQTDWNGNQTTYVNDTHGQPTAVNEAVGSAVARTTSITYDAPTFVHLPKTIVTPGLTAGFTYDTSGNPLTTTLTDTTTTTAPYSTSGQTRTWTNTWSNFLLASTKGPRTDVAELTSFAYDASGAVTAITNALGQVTKITAHTGGGLPLTIVDPNGVTTNQTYDGRQRLLTSTVVTAAGPLTTKLAYDAAGNLLSTTLPDGSALANTYDAAHRLTKITDLFHQTVNYTLDAFGDRTQTTLAAVGNRTQRQHSDSFDALGRVLHDVGGVGQTTTLIYDPDGNAPTVSDPLGHITKRTFDALNRVSQITDANNGVTTIAYDAHDRPLSVTDPNSHATTYVYDGFGDLIQQTSPDSGITVYRYDPAANLTQKTDAAGAVTNNTYDALDRIITTSFPADTPENVTYSYDQAGHGFGIGRLTSLTDAAGSLSRSYDERGNRTGETRVSNGTTLSTSYSYDAASRISSTTYPSGWTVSQTRDIMGRIWQLPITAPGGAPAGNAITNATYEPFGPLYTLTFGNGINEARHFDLDYRVTALADAGATAIQGLDYAYDAADNVQSIANIVTTANSQSFGYDVLNRLTSATGNYGSFAWSYDKVGNRSTQTLGGAATTYSYATGSNRLASYTGGGITEILGYTATGNINSLKPGSNAATTTTYNQANRLALVTTPAQSAAYTYDAFGQRLVKSQPGNPPTLFQYAQSGELLEETFNGFPMDYVYLNGRPVAEIIPSTGKVYFLQDDRLGTPQLATDSGQNVVWGTTYQPFGQTALPGGTLTQNLRLPGQYFDGETGFSYNLFRDYMPYLGRYLEADPIGLAGGLNAYEFVLSNPPKLTDPTGLDVQVYTIGGHAIVRIDTSSNVPVYFGFSPGPFEPIVIGTLFTFAVPGYIQEEQEEGVPIGDPAQISRANGDLLAETLRKLEGQRFFYHALLYNCYYFAFQVRNFAKTIAH